MCIHNTDAFHMLHIPHDVIRLLCVCVCVCAPSVYREIPMDIPCIYNAYLWPINLFTLKATYGSYCNS